MDRQNGNQPNQAQAAQAKNTLFGAGHTVPSLPPVPWVYKLRRAEFINKYPLWDVGIDELELLEVAEPVGQRTDRKVLGGP